MRSPEDRLRDILDAIAAIDRYLDRGLATFEHDELLQSWLARNLQVIGEAARALPAELRETAPEVPWRAIIGMRNILVHGHFDIDTDAVWRTATQDLPALRVAVILMLEASGGDGGGA